MHELTRASYKDYNPESRQGSSCPDHRSPDSVLGLTQTTYHSSRGS